MKRLFRRLTAPLREWADRNPVIATLALVVLGLISAAAIIAMAVYRLTTGAY